MGTPDYPTRRELDGPPARRAPLGSPSRDRSFVELPSWVVDEVLAPAKPTAFRLVVMLYRHGWETRDRNGDRRIWWRGSLAELGRITGATKPHIIEAERYLAGVGFLTVHQRNDPRAPHAISVPIERPSGNKLLPAPEAIFRQHDGALEIEPDPDQDFSNTTTTTQPPPAEAVTICDRLAAYGVSNPALWLRQCGPKRCTDALDYVDSIDPATLRNPAGFLHRIVHGSHTIATPPTRQPAYPSTFEERKALYLGGQLRVTSR